MMQWRLKQAVSVRTTQPAILMDQPPPDEEGRERCLTAEQRLAAAVDRGPWVTDVGNQPHWRLQGKQSAPCPFLSAQGLSRVPAAASLWASRSELFLTSLCTQSISNREAGRVLFLCAFSEQGNILSAVGSITLAPLQHNSTRALLLLTPSTD